MQLLPHALYLLSLVMYHLVCRHTNTSSRAICAANQRHDIQNSSELMDIRPQAVMLWSVEYLEGPWFFQVPW